MFTPVEIINICTLYCHWSIEWWWLNMPLDCNSLAAKRLNITTKKLEDLR